MAVDKAALLAAIAQGGTAGKAAYEQAQAALAQQQQEAVRMALSSGVAQDSNSGAQAEIQRIIGQPYQNRTAQLTSNQAAMTDWFNRMGVNAGQWGDVMNGLQEAVAARAAAEAAGGGGGSGGGSGGGGGGGDEKPYDWYAAALDDFGTGDALKTGIATLAKENDPHISGMPNYKFGQQYLMDEYGAPELAAAGFSAQPKDDATFERTLMQAAQGVNNRQQLRKFVKTNRKYGAQNPTVNNRGYYQSQARQAAKARVAAKATKRKGKR